MGSAIKMFGPHRVPSFVSAFSEIFPPALYLEAVLNRFVTSDHNLHSLSHCKSYKWRLPHLPRPPGLCPLCSRDRDTPRHHALCHNNTGRTPSATPSLLLRLPPLPDFPSLKTATSLAQELMKLKDNRSTACARPHPRAFLLPAEGLRHDSPLPLFSSGVGSGGFTEDCMHLGFAIITPLSSGSPNSALAAMGALCGVPLHLTQPLRESVALHLSLNPRIVTGNLRLFSFGKRRASSSVAGYYASHILAGTARLSLQCCAALADLFGVHFNVVTIPSKDAVLRSHLRTLVGLSTSPFIGTIILSKDDGRWSYLTKKTHPLLTSSPPVLTIAQGPKPKRISLALPLLPVS